MNETNETIQPESRPEVEISDSAETPENDQEELEPEQTQETSPEKQPPSKFVRWLRKGLIGLAIVALIFFGGFLTDHFVRYVPLSKALESTQAELEQANEAVSDLQEENDRLASANQAAEDEIADLEDALTAAKANLKFYQVLVDVNTARIELFLEDIESAQAALENTQDNLEDLLPFIEEVDSELALSLPRRLELIISGLARDPETARIDLELLTKDLLALEPLLVLD
jgi:DNA repair exonuclease SbcCD ATPase subunit